MQSNEVKDYAVERRRLGIVYVGAIVLFSVVALATNLAKNSFGISDASTADWFRKILCCIVAFDMLSFPFDLSGYLIEKKHSKTNKSLLQFLLRWSQAVFKHSLLLLIGIFLLSSTVAIAGIYGVALGTLLLSVFFIWKQGETARFLSNVQFDELDQNFSSGFLKVKKGQNHLAVARVQEEGFTGGIIGLPGAETLVIPHLWLSQLTEAELDIELVRRQCAIDSGSRTRGIIGACVFTVLGATLAAFAVVKGFGLELSSSAGIVTMSLVYTLWSFLGLLILPTINQKGVIEADQNAIKKGVERDRLIETLVKLDAQMENEPGRSEAVQRIFHPVPTIERRIEALDGIAIDGAWHIARYAIWLSIVALGLLGRAVHCNAGKPDLWCMLPAD